jgi:hypothetical protein
LDAVEEYAVNAIDKRSNGLIITAGQQYSGRSATFFGPNKLTEFGLM